MWDEQQYRSLRMQTDGAARQNVAGLFLDRETFQVQKTGEINP